MQGQCPRLLHGVRYTLLVVLDLFRPRWHAAQAQLLLQPVVWVFPSDGREVGDEEGEAVSEDGEDAEGREDLG